MSVNIRYNIKALEHIIEEMKNLNVSDGEEEELNEKRTLLMNKEKVPSFLGTFFMP